MINYTLYLPCCEIHLRPCLLSCILTKETVCILSELYKALLTHYIKMSKHHTSLSAQATDVLLLRPWVFKTFRYRNSTSGGIQIWNFPPELIEIKDGRVDNLLLPCCCLLSSISWLGFVLMHTFIRVNKNTNINCRSMTGCTLWSPLWKSDILSTWLHKG